MRIDRLEEAVTVLKGCWGSDPLTFSGKHYQIDGYDGLPKPTQKPRPPLLVGGGGKRVLRLAGREADIVGINLDLRSDATRRPDGPVAGGIITAAAAVTGTAEAVDQKIQWVREGAGDRFEELEFNITGFITQVTDDVEDTAGALGATIGMPGGTLLDMPFVLIGPIEWLADILIERRERYGINYITFPMAVIPNGYDVLSPLVQRLSGA
jgi:alkanesulfonate monooxygenase SsuD/methylene tetrahydromethanopterin reductase-like flavin-dependent oxidoreductase (luciferase family)